MNSNNLPKTYDGTITAWSPSAECSYSNDSDVANARKHILFIDDDYLLVQLGMRTLRHHNYAVSGFRHSEEALQIFRDNPYQFDAVVMDHHMPILDGQELAREMLSLRPNLPIIMMSGYVGPEDAKQMRQLGVRKILSKSDALLRIDEVLLGIVGPSQLTERAVSMTSETLVCA